MPRARRAPDQVDAVGREIITSDRTERRLNALRENEGRWVAWNETMDEVLASAETFEGLDEIVERLRAASPGEERRYILNFVEPPMRISPGAYRREVSL